VTRGEGGTLEAVIAAVAKECVMCAAFEAGVTEAVAVEVGRDRASQPEIVGRHHHRYAGATAERENPR
jgi:hypothetical protein